jgi:YHS domain-containing protein
MGKLAASRTIRIAIASVGIAVCTVAFTLPMRGQEVPLKQQLRGRHRLLRRVFVNAGDNDVKGLAATIKADEITVRHRIKAVRYLATVDSGSYPEAKQMLIDTLHNDKWEEVRFEAAKALRLMLAGNASGAERTPRLFRMWLRRWRRHTRRRFRTSIRGRRDFYKNSCDPITLRGLVKTAYELDADGHAFEPSLRVRQAAVNAIRDSGVACDVGPYIAGAAPSAFPVQTDSPAYEVLPLDPEFGQLQELDAAAFDVASEAAPAAMPIVNSDWETQVNDDFAVARSAADSGTEPVVAPTIRPVSQSVDNTGSPVTTTARCLQGFCIVGLRHEKEIPARPEFNTVYQERLYQFSSAEALAEFDTDPEQYALAYGGFDPVVYASSQEMAEGTILCMFDGFFYSFASEENWEEFQSQPDLYALRPEDLLTDEEYLAQAIRDFQELENQAAQSETPPELATTNQPEPIQSGDKFAPMVDTDQPAATDQQLTLNQQLNKTPTAADFDPSDLNLIPPPPVAADQDIVREEFLFGSSKSEDLIGSGFENPFEDANGKLTTAPTPEEGLAEASRVLGLTGSDEPPGAEQEIAFSSEPADSSHSEETARGETPEALNDKRHITVAPAPPPEPATKQPRDVIEQEFANEVPTVTPREQSNQPVRRTPASTVRRWSDLGLQESRTDTTAAEPKQPSKSAPRFTDSEPPGRQGRTTSPQRKPREVRRAPVETRRTPVEPGRINEASVVAKRIGERLTPNQPAPKGWASFITQSGNPTGKTIRKIGLSRTNPFTQALRSEDQGFRVTQITAGTKTAPRRSVESVTTARAVEIRKRRSSAHDLKRPATGADSTLRPVRKSRTAALVPVERPDRKSPLVRPATTSRTPTLKPVESSKFQTLTGPGSKSQAIRQTSRFGSSLLRRK